MAKYDPLALHLSKRHKRKVRLKFKQIERIIGSRLPPSARKHGSWWSGNSAVWLHNGWRAVPNVRRKRVTFLRDRKAKQLLAQRLTPPRQAGSRKHRPSRQRRRAAKRTGNWAGTTFGLVCRIEPLRKGKKILEDQPQSRYDNKRKLPLNKWGGGPLCKFRIPPTPRQEGVYVIAVNGNAQYVGECEDLTTRFNNGYGSISPRACFVGGQPTNCRINTFVLAEAKKGNHIDLWFAPSADRKALEASLIRELRPAWNRK